MNELIDWTLLERIDTAHTNTRIGYVSREVASTLGFRNFFFGIRVPVGPRGPTQMVVSGCPRGWREQFDQDYTISMDPNWLRVMETGVAFFSDSPGFRRPETAAALRLAARFGLKHGVVVPLYGRAGSHGMFLLVRSSPLPFDEHNRKVLECSATLYALRIFERALSIILKSSNLQRTDKGVLTHRERECLGLAANGYTGKQIARVMNVAPRTVVYHMDCSMKKLRTNSRRAAITRALMLGEISMHQYPDKLALSTEFFEVPASDLH